MQISTRSRSISPFILLSLLALACNKPQKAVTSDPPSAVAESGQMQGSKAPDTQNQEKQEPAGLDEMPEAAPSTPKLPTTLTDQSRSLDDILEKGTLSKDDCDRYAKGQKDRETSLRCGKWMFFYGHLEVPGSPAKIVDLIRESAPKTVGRSLEHFGLYPDPHSKRALPIGLSDGPDMVANVPTYTLTCAACHFGRTTDGRYVVGQPNHQFEFGKFTLSVATIPEAAAQPLKKQPAEVKKIFDPIQQEVFGSGANRIQAVAQALSLLPSVIITKISPPNDAAKVELALLPKGVMDPYSSPSLDDGVRIPVRMSPLWGIDPEAMTAAGSTHGAMLGSNGGAPDVQHIMRTSAHISGKIRALPLGKNYKAEDVQPLVDYILSLESPKAQKTVDEAKRLAGGALFKQHCYACHNGPGFAGTRVFDIKEIGTDPNIERLVDKDNTGKALFDVLTPEELTKGIRARRLAGVWSMTRFFHNGSSASLAEVFCLDGPRKDSGLGSGYSSAGHMYTCDGLSREDKVNLITFLESL